MIGYQLRHAIGQVIQGYLPHHQRTASISTTATPNSVTDISGASLTIIPTAPCTVRLSIYFALQNNTDADRITITIQEDGVDIWSGDFKPDTAGTSSPFVMIFEKSATGSSHIYKVRWNNNHAGDALQITQGNLFVDWWTY